MKQRLHTLAPHALTVVLLLAVVPTGAVAQSPTEAAPLPTAHPADVISIFSGAYGNVPVAEFSTGWDDADVSDFWPGGDQSLVYSIYQGGGFAALQMAYPGFDASAMTHFHMDVWTAAAPTNGFAIKLVDFGPNAAYGDGGAYPANWPFDDQEAVVPIDYLTPGAWTSIDIPLSDFVFAGSGLPMTLSSISQVLIEGFGMTVYVDNIHFSRPTTPKPSTDLFMVDTKSGEVRRVTSLYDSEEYGAAMSNDGKTIVHDVVTFQPYYTHRLALTDVATGTSTPLEYGEGGNDARFSPNGRFLVFDRGAVGDATLYLAVVKGSNAGSATVLRAGALNADWSNDSKRVVFQDISDGSIRTMDVATGAETIVAAAGEGPVWSPNGQSIAFGRYDGSVPGTAIFAVDVNKDGTPKGQPVQLTPWTPDAYPGNATWSNNSRRVVYQGNPGHGDWNFDLWTVAATGGTPSVLFGNPAGGEYDPAYSSDGRYVLFSTWNDPGVAPKGFDGVVFHAVADEDVLPAGFALEQNYPNPFNPSTSIHFAVPEAGQVRLAVFDVTGREVAVLVDRPMEAGSHSVTWSAAAGLPSGTYLYRLTAGGVSQTRLLTLVK